MKDLVSIIILIFLGYLFITMKKKKNEAEAKGELIDDKGLAYVEVAMLLGSATFTGILFYNLVQPSIGMVGAAVFAMFGMAFNFGEPYAIRLIVATGQHNDKDRGLIPFYMISVALVKVVSIIAMSTVLYGLFTHNADKIRAMDYKIAAANERVKHINQSARNQLRSASQIKDPARRRQAVAAARSNQSAMSSRQYDQMANFEESKPINMQPTFAGFSIPRAIESSLLAVAWEFILTLLCVFNAKFISPISKPGLVKFASKHLDWSVPQSLMKKMGLIGSPAPGVVKQDENLNANEPSSALADETKPAPLYEETYAEVRKEMLQRGFKVSDTKITPPNDISVEEYQQWTARLNASNDSQERTRSSDGNAPVPERTRVRSQSHANAGHAPVPPKKERTGNALGNAPENALGTHLGNAPKQDAESRVFEKMLEAHIRAADVPVGNDIACAVCGKSTKKSTDTKRFCSKEHRMSYAKMAKRHKNNMSLVHENREVA